MKKFYFVCSHYTKIALNIELLCSHLLQMSSKLFGYLITHFSLLECYLIKHVCSIVGNIIGIFCLFFYILLIAESISCLTEQVLYSNYTVWHRETFFRKLQLIECPLMGINDYLIDSHCNY